MSTTGLRMKRRYRKGTARLNHVTKLIDELRLELAISKEEMNQRIDESIRTYLSQKEPSDSGRVWSIRNIFINSYLDGLRELADVNLNWIVKTVWLLILFVNLVFLIFGLITIVKDYLDEATITKVHQIDTNFTQINRPSICLPLFQDFLYLKTNSGSKDDHPPIDNQSLHYVGYIKALMPLFASSGLWLSHIPSENLTWSQFESIPARSSFSISYEQASSLSQNTLYGLLYYWGIGQTNLTTSKRSRFYCETSLYSEILMKEIVGSVEYYRTDSRICLPIRLLQIGLVTANKQKMYWFQYQHYASGEGTNLSLDHQMLFYSIHFNAKIYSLSIPYRVSYLEKIYRYKEDTNAYLLVPTKYIHLNLTRQPCYDALGEIYPRGYGKAVCFHDCLWKNHATLFNCSFWEDLSPDEQQNIKVCHIFDIFHQLRSNMSQMCKNDQNQLWCNNETMRSVGKWNQLLMQTYRELVIDKASSIGDCESKCANFTFCEEWELQFELVYKHDTVEFISDTIDPNSSSGLIAHRQYAISSFVSVNEDVLKASLAEFMANLGGIIGLYFGASICGYLHLMLFLLISCCRKVTKMANKSASGSRRSNDERIGEQ